MYIPAGTLILLILFLINPTEGQFSDFLGDLKSMLLVLFSVTLFLVIAYVLYGAATGEGECKNILIGLGGIAFPTITFIPLYKKYKKTLTEEDIKEWGNPSWKSILFSLAFFSLSCYLIYDSYTISKGDHISKVFKILGKPEGFFKGEKNKLSWFYHLNKEGNKFRAIVFNSKGKVVYDKTHWD